MFDRFCMNKAQQEVESHRREKATMKEQITVDYCPFVILQSDWWREENVPKHTYRAAFNWSLFAFDISIKETTIAWFKVVAN